MKLDHVRLFFHPSPQTLQHLAGHLRILNGSIRKAHLCAIKGQIDVWAAEHTVMEILRSPDLKGSAFQSSISRTEEKARSSKERFEKNPVYPLLVQTDHRFITSAIETVYMQAIDCMEKVLTLDLDIHEHTWVEIGFRTDEDRKAFVGGIHPLYKKLQALTIKEEARRIAAQ